MKVSMLSFCLKCVEEVLLQLYDVVCGALQVNCVTLTGVPVILFTPTKQ